MSRIPKYFFEKGSYDEFCHTLKYFEAKIALGEAEEFHLTDAAREYGNGFFYCAELNEFGESGNSDCGKSCWEYKPRNGKSGRCIHSQPTFIEGDRKFKLTKDGLKEIKRKIIDDL